MELTLGKRIVQNRKRLGLTQDALAEKLGVTAQAVSKWENDQSCPDITMLPKLAEIFGTSTDALLGITEDTPAKEATVVQDEQGTDGFQFRNGNWEFKYDTSRRSSLMLAVSVLLIGALYLCSSIFVWDLSLWDIAWPSFLLVFGLFGLYPRFSFFRLGVALFGGYFLLSSLLNISALLDHGAVVAVALLIIGGTLLVDALRKPQKPRFQFTRTGNHGNSAPQHDFYIKDDSFHFDAAFGDCDQQVNMPLLRSGMINTSFGDYEVDLSGVEALADQCRIEANTSFGDLTVWVPSKYQVQCASSTAFASVEIDGKPDPLPAGTIQLVANASFGQITVEYV